MRKHKRRNRMRVCDEKKVEPPRGALGGSRGIEDEGLHFKIKGWIKVMADVYPVSAHTNTVTLFLFSRRAYMR